MIDAVVFDLDGVLIESEQRWDAARRAVVAEAGRPFPDGATRAMQGMSAPEWQAYLHDELGVPEAPEQIGRAVVDEIVRGYRDDLPLLPGATDAVRALAGRWTLAVASSANAELIDLVLELAGLGGDFAATVSSEEVARGKPAPDVYLEAARRVGARPGRCIAIEDSSNGLRSAAAAGMVVVAVPNRDYPPDPDALALAAASVGGVAEVTPRLIAGLDPEARG
ncbi:HAD family hydrolase [Capillimicrobium parvum]|uniref:Hexitol phosphatase B n=1 Tax=Capillimicrobium parvum TaxID=2884022 RepID=A0A9E7C0X3_9ACTN|nr:HAD family phosphatase [Capillimicrobium parvum]UGS36059.1 Hexitol phosphatase B [Capillimicrobium parvum]